MGALYSRTLSAAVCKQPLPGKKKEEDAVFSLRGKRCKVKQRRGGMEGDEYPFLGLILLSGVAISVFLLSPKFAVVYASAARARVSSLSRIIFAMLVWQRCRYTAAPATVQATAQQGGRKHNALLSLCLKIFGVFFLPSPPPTAFVFVQAFAGRWKSVTAAGFDVRLSLWHS